MVMNAKLGTQTFGAGGILAEGHTPFCLARPLKADQGEIPAGQIMALDADGELVPYAQDDQSLGTGDGAATDFSGTLVNAPIEPGSVVVSADLAELTDDGHGHLTGDGAGTIKYETGAVVVSFDAAPAADVDVSAQSYNLIAGVMVNAVDSSGDTTALIAVHGTVRKGALLVEDAAASAEILQKLENTGIYPI